MGTIMKNFSSGDVLQSIGESYVGRMDGTATAEAELRRYVALRMRAFQGFRLGDTGAIVRPDSEGMILLHSSDDTATIEDVPKPHAINITVAA